MLFCFGYQYDLPCTHLQICDAELLCVFNCVVTSISFKVIRAERSWGRSSDRRLYDKPTSLSLTLITRSGCALLNQYLVLIRMPCFKTVPVWSKVKVYITWFFNSLLLVYFGYLYSGKHLTTRLRGQTWTPRSCRFRYYEDFISRPGEGASANQCSSAKVMKEM